MNQNPDYKNSLNSTRPASPLRANITTCNSSRP